MGPPQRGLASTDIVTSPSGRVDCIAEPKKLKKQPGFSFGNLAAARSLGYLKPLKPSRGTGRAPSAPCCARNSTLLGRRHPRPSLPYYGAPEYYAVLYTKCVNVDWSGRPGGAPSANGCIQSTFGAAYTYDKGDGTKPRLFFSNNLGLGLFEVLIPDGGVPCGNQTVS